MNFEEWWTQRETVAGCDLDGADNASAAWGYQQNRIDRLEWNLDNVKHALKEQKKLTSLSNNKTDELEELVKAYDIQAYSEGYQEGKKECLFDTQEEHDRYELEQAIMSCWGITDDLHLLADAMESGEHKRMHHEMLLNLSQLYELKFQKLFKEFNKFTGCY